MPRLRRRRKAAVAQITEQSRVGKLACQRGGEGCSASVATWVATKRIAPKAKAFAARRSKVQISVSFIEKSEKH